MIESAPIERKRDALWEVVNGRLLMYFHAGQWRAWNSSKRFVMVFSGTQGGKTSFGPLWMHREIERKGPGDYLAVAPTFPLMNNKMLPEFIRLFQNTLGLGEYRASRKTFEFYDGEHRVIFGSADAPESLESATAKAAWLDELGQKQFKLNAWEAVRRRLSLARGRVLGTTTLYTVGWLKQLVYDRARRGEIDADIIQFASTMNPAFSQEEFDEARDSMQDWKFRMQYCGQFDRPAGLIYACFNDAMREEGGHLVSPRSMQWPKQWPIYLGVDFGGVNTAVLYVARDPSTNVYYALHSTLDGGMTAREHVAIVKSTLKGRNYVGAWGGSKSEDQWRREWGAAGLAVNAPPATLTTGSKDSIVETGIDRCTALIKANRFYVANTKSNAALVDEFTTYSRVVDELGNPSEKIEAKETFHRMDAWRYIGQVLDGMNTYPSRSDGKRATARYIDTSARSEVASAFDNILGG